MAYRTLHGEMIDLTALSVVHRRVYEEAKQFISQEPEWPAFSNFWVSRTREINASAESDIFKILQDIDSRLGLRHGLTRHLNWREQLELLIRGKFRSRYAFCKATGVDEGHLSSVLKGKKSLSIATLERMLNKIGFRMILVEANVSSTGEE